MKVKVSAKFLCLVLVTSLFFTSVFSLNSLTVLAATAADTPPPETSQLSNEEIALDEISILEEDVQQRTANSKEFIREDMSRIIALYPYDVHFQENGEWKDIDNSLVQVQKNEDSNKIIFSNTAHSIQISLPEKLQPTEQVKIYNGEYQIGFSVQSIQTPDSRIRAAALDTQSKDIETSHFNTVLSERQVLEQLAQGFSVSKEAVQTSQSALDIVGLSENQIKMMPKNLNPKALYINALPNTDIKYSLNPNILKEDIIIKRKPASAPVYAFKINSPGLTAQVDTNNNIYFYSNNDHTRQNEIFAMPMPFMVDANGQVSYDVQIQLTPISDGYVLYYTPDYTWMSEHLRSYPITLDPVIKPSLSTSNIRDTTVSSANPNSNYQTAGVTDIGRSSSGGIQRFFLKYRQLPVLKSADIIVDAQIALYRPYNASSSGQINVHKVEKASGSSTWESSTLTWNNKPDYNTIIEDYKIVKNAAWYNWTITDMVQEWYRTGYNTGMMFKGTNAIENGTSAVNKTFLTSDYSNEGNPVLFISYRNTAGLESYWNYHSHDIGRAGVGAVNDFTGNLVFSRTEMSFSGTRLPVTIQRIYNANEKDTNTGYGYGWHLNYAQKIQEVTLSGDTYYSWKDEDATVHYFKKSGTQPYKDEDGLDLKLMVQASGNKYIIEDKTGGKLEFDTNGRLVKTTSKQTLNSQITIEYTGTTDKVSRIVDGAGRVYTFSYNAQGLANTLNYYGTGSTALESLQFAYDSNSNLTGATYQDGKTVSYIYDSSVSHLLKQATNIDGTSANYTYSFNTTADTNNRVLAPPRVTQVESKGTDGTVAGRLSMEYQHNATKFTDITQKSEIIQFNNFGNALCIQDDQGNAEYVQYARDDEDTSGKTNQLTLSSKLQNTVVNRIRSASFEQSDSLSYWTCDNSGGATGTASLDATAKYLGLKSLKVVHTNNLGHTELRQSTSFNIQRGKTYTLSAYVNLIGNSGGDKGAILTLYNDAQVQWSEKISNLSAGAMGWKRIEVTLTVAEDSPSTQLTCGLLVDSLPTASVYFDCVQLEEASTASRYNLLENNDLQSSTTQVNGWDWGRGSHVETRDGITTANTSANPKMETSVYALNGEPTLDKRVYQDVKISSGQAGDVYTVGGWAKGNAVPKTSEDRHFGILVRFYNTNDSQTEKYFEFNPDCKEWQYLSARVVATQSYHTVRVIQLYQFNANQAFFDGFQLFKEEFGHSYVYDSDGNVISVKDLKQQNTTYEYSDNLLTKATLPNGAIYTYTYDANKNVKTATTSEAPKVTYNFDYDTYGNNTKVYIQSDGKQLVSSATYTADGNNIATVIDENGQTTSYTYDLERSLLLSTTDPNGSTVEKQYDTFGRILSVRNGITSSNNSNYSQNNYVYTNDRLTTLSHSGQSGNTGYTYSYDSLGRISDVQLGTRTLVSYNYDNAIPQQINAYAYGNGDLTTYEYDEQNRVISARYDQDINDRFAYQYDTRNNLSEKLDKTDELKTKYIYDFADRLSFLRETGTGTRDYIHECEWLYDDNNNLNQFIESTNGVKHAMSYAFDGDSRPVNTTYSYSSALQNHTVKKEWIYDTFGRIESLKTYDYTGDTPINILATEYSFNDYSTSGQNYTSTQVTSLTNRRACGSGFNQTFQYEYDNKGNIVQVYDGVQTWSYAYDSFNQLVRENNPSANATYIYTYDIGGNIIQTKKYPYTSGNLGSIMSTDTYTYDNSEWKDLLTKYNGQDIVYDAIGNPLTDGTWTYSWEGGRRLAGMQKAGSTITYQYNDTGIRTNKTINGVTTTYTLVGEHVTSETTEATTLQYRYDNENQLISIRYNQNEYYYIRNLQGDIIALADSNGNLVVEYSYDAWGNLLSTTGGMAASLGATNPYRYRGYRYDSETGLYYLQSRYYSPALKRMLNADAIIESGSGATSMNLFAYCGNNPVMRSDPEGKMWSIIAGIVHYSIQKTIEKAMAYIKAASKKTIAKNTHKTRRTLLPGQTVPKLFKTDYTGPANSYVNITNKNGDIIKRRYYGPNGRAMYDIDYIDHGNPKNHNKPHKHTFDWSNLDKNGNPEYPKGSNEPVNPGDDWANGPEQSQISPEPSNVSRASGWEILAGILLGIVSVGVWVFSGGMYIPVW